MYSALANVPHVYSSSRKAIAHTLVHAQCIRSSRSPASIWPVLCQFVAADYFSLSGRWSLAQDVCGRERVLAVHEYCYNDTELLQG